MCFTSSFQLFDLLFSNSSNNIIITFKPLSFLFNPANIMSSLHRITLFLNLYLDHLPYVTQYQSAHNNQQNQLASVTKWESGILLPIKTEEYLPSIQVYLHTPSHTAGKLHSRWYHEESIPKHKSPYLLHSSPVELRWYRIP